MLPELFDEPEAQAHDFAALEKDLLPSEKWKEVWLELPEIARTILSEEAGTGIGLGRNEAYGWFILFSSGQGPGFVWSERTLENTSQ